MVMFDLTGKTALVCGSTRGIGRACADVLARQGAAVTLMARDARALEAAAAALDRGRGQHHEYLAADFADPTAVRAVIDGFVGQGGQADILVNNTGGPPGGPILDAAPEAFLRALSMHVVCNHHLVQALSPGMKQRGFGRIINVISTSVKQPIPGLGVSNTTRAAVANWAKTLADELGPFGITVNSILPGYTATERLESLIHAKAEREGRSPDEIRRAWIDSTPARRLGRPEEIAAAVAFLASDEAAFINGVALAVDGGRTLSL